MGTVSRVFLICFRLYWSSMVVSSGSVVSLWIIVFSCSSVCWVCFLMRGKSSCGGWVFGWFSFQSRWVVASRYSCPVGVFSHSLWCSCSLLKKTRAVLW